MQFEKKYLLLLVAAICVGLYFYGQPTKNNSYLKHLPTIGGLAYGLNTLINLAQPNNEQLPKPEPAKSTSKSK